MINFTEPDLCDYSSPAVTPEHNFILRACLTLTDLFLDSLLKLEILPESIANEIDFQHMEG